MNESIPAYSPSLIKEFESDIGVPDGFFSKIIHEDDWSFVVKLHGMIEAGLTQLILAHFGDTRLELPISKMNMNGASGKLAFVRALELLPPHNISFIQKLSEMRNTITHQISNISFSIATHIQALDPQQLRNLVESCGDGIMPEISLLSTQSYEERCVEQLKNEPRRLFWWSSVYVLGNITKSKRWHSLKRKLAEMEREMGCMSRQLFAKTEAKPTENTELANTNPPDNV